MAGKSILDGLYPAIDRWLNIEDIGLSPHHRHRSASNKVSGKPIGSIDGYQLITELLAIIEENWSRSTTFDCEQAAEKNWRLSPWRKKNGKTNSPELALEQAMVELSPDNWANQVATAAGLDGSHPDRARAIDLVYKNAAREYTFFELKIDSDTPLFAAVEILIYGLLYIFSRQHLADLGYDAKAHRLLKAKTIHLRTLAPKTFYGDVDLIWLDKAINVGLSKYLAQSNLSLTMDFGFITITEEFEWPRNKSELPKIMARVCMSIS